jgi:DNA-binding transcriptional MocR family regulator
MLAPGEAFGQKYRSFARLCYTSVPETQLLVGIARLGAAIRASE